MDSLVMIYFICMLINTNRISTTVRGHCFYVFIEKKNMFSNKNIECRGNINTDAINEMSHTLPLSFYQNMAIKEHFPMKSKAHLFY